MKKQYKNFMNCDFCNLEAIVNFQKIWEKFIIDKNGRYREDRKFNGGDFEESIEWDNIHLCKKHSKQWIKGEI